jgi:hypothetical protein
VAETGEAETERRTARAEVGRDLHLVRHVRGENKSASRDNEHRRKKESAGVGSGAGRTREEERKGWMRTRDRVRSLLAASLRSRLFGSSSVLRKLLRLATMGFNRLYSGKGFIAAFISTVLKRYSALEQQVLLFCGKGGPVRRCTGHLCVFSNADVVGGYSTVSDIMRIYPASKSCRHPRPAAPRPRSFPSAFAFAHALTVAGRSARLHSCGAESAFLFLHSAP